MSFNLAINLYVILAIVGIVAGLFFALMGFADCADPEGRGGSLLLLIPVGAIIFLGSLGYCLYRLGAVFGFWG